jgi:hypothetical protein
VVVEKQRVITKVYFLRLILPIAATLSGLVDFSIGLVILLGFVLAHGITCSHHPAYTSVSAPGRFHGVGCGPLALGAECVVSRYPIPDSVHRAVLDVGFTSVLLELHGTGRASITWAA